MDNSPKRFAPDPGISLKLTPALCLDFDGTIRHSKSGDFISGPDDIELFPGVESKIWEYREQGFLVFGISNQAGVAFGHKTPRQNDAEMEATFALFHKNPFHIAKWAYHHPGGNVWPYNVRSLMRKPDVGMLAWCEGEAFEAGYVVDWNNSVFVGDRPEDEETAKNAGIKFVHADDFFGRK